MVIPEYQKSGAKEPPRPSAQKSSTSLPKAAKKPHTITTANPFPVVPAPERFVQVRLFSLDGNTITESPLRERDITYPARSPGVIFLILLHSTMPDLPQDIVQIRSLRKLRCGNLLKFPASFLCFHRNSEHPSCPGIRPCGFRR